MGLIRKYATLTKPERYSRETVPGRSKEKSPAEPKPDGAHGRVAMKFRAFVRIADVVP